MKHGCAVGPKLRVLVVEDEGQNQSNTSAFTARGQFFTWL